MADLIDRQKVLDAFKQICDRCGKHEQYNGVMCGACYLDDAISIVDDIPPVVDTDLSGSSFRLYRAAYDRGKQDAMAKIVHCKECKYATMTMDGECKYCDIWFPDEPVYTEGDYFCASGERREE